MPILLKARKYGGRYVCYRTFRSAASALAKARRWSMKRAAAYVAAVERGQRYSKTVARQCRGRAGKTAKAPRFRRRYYYPRYYRRRRRRWW